MTILKDRIALITGASRGIGAAVAKRFAAEGAHVILVARTVGGLEEVDDAITAAGGVATLVPLDLREFDKIDELGGILNERFGKLDILVGNAAILGGLSPMSHFDTKIWQAAIDINVTANWRLIRSMDLLLRRSEAGRAIFVTSGVTSLALPYWGLYTATKAALEAIVRSYAAENERTNLRANLLAPGIVRTAMRAQAMPDEDPDALRPPEAVTDAFVELAAANCQRNGEIVSAA